jgi:hypothetical protein
MCQIIDECLNADGLKCVETVFFWAPTMKWGLVVAGLSDMNRPPEKISVPQATALTGTGLIWSRYATQIIPYNLNLLVVNLFVAMTGGYQLYRKISYELNKPKEEQPPSTA